MRRPLVLRFAVPFGVLALLLLAAPAQAQRSLAEKIEDLRRASAVRAALAEDAETRAYDVDVRAEAGVVSLAGLVPTLGVRERAEQIAGGVAGVRAVRNDLRLDGQADTPVVHRAPVRTAEEEAVRADPDEAQPVYHSVRQGDTLFSIARRYGTTVEAVQRLNRMGDSTALRTGQRLRVR